MCERKSLRGDEDPHESTDEVARGRTPRISEVTADGGYLCAVKLCGEVTRGEGDAQESCPEDYNSSRSCEDNPANQAARQEPKNTHTERTSVFAHLLPKNTGSCATATFLRLYQPFKRNQEQLSNTVVWITC